MQVLDQTADIVIVTDAKARIEYVNPAFEKITGFSQDNAIGQNLIQFLSCQNTQELCTQAQNVLLSGEVFQNEITSTCKNGTIYHARITMIPLIDNKHKITHFIATLKDIFEHVYDQLHIQHQLNHDALTDLPGRAIFLDRLQHAISKAHYHNRLVAILFIDLDLFSNINNLLDPETGDHLIQQLSQRFNNTIREGDTIARFGSDEFVILLDDFDSDETLSVISQKLLDSIASPFKVKEQEINITASIGISIYPSDGNDPESLLRNADIAMYRAKELGKNNFQYFSESMTARVFERITLKNSLRHALEREEFELYYQPQFDARDGSIFGVEALLRWQHPELGLITPAHFIPLLEETGLIEPVGIWILKTACLQSKKWHDTGLNFQMSVNLSSRQFNNASFITSLKSIISDTQINPQDLELELTESMLMRNASSTINALKNLNDLGVRFAIDDFGTGYSSLNYLRRFPIDTIKIDRSFIRDITTDTDDMAICSAIIGMAHSLSLNVIAEGVETKAQLEFLKDHGCYYIQGNYLGYPKTAMQLEQLFRSKTPGIDNSICSIN